MALWPLVVDRLVQLLPGLPGWAGVSVFDGPPATGSTPAQFATVGYVAGEATSGNYTRQQAPDGFRYEETGSVVSQLVCETGDVAIPSMRLAVCGLADQIDAAIRLDRTLGVLSPEGYCTVLVDVVPLSNQQGTGVALTFTLTYYTVN